MRTGAVLLVAAVLAAPAWAERGDREKEIVVGADRLTADDANRTSTFDGSVVVTQGTMRMTAARVTVKEDTQRHKVYVANGAPVTFRQKRDKVDEWVEGYAERAEFDDRNDVLKLFGNARVKSNQNEITGDFITYDMKREVAEVSGAAPGKTGTASTGRVKVIIVPPKKEAEGEGKDKEKDKAKPAPALELKSDPGKG
jgi:lipopolysaccharide export system protein LptA